MYGFGGGSVIKRIIGLVIFFSIMRFVVYISPLHVYFDYKRDITELKRQHMDRFGFFPDKLPEGASEAVWHSIPECLSGFGEYYLLTFNAGDDYLEEIYDTYAEEAVVYTYGTDIDGYEGWVNEDTGYAECPFIPDFQYGEYEGKDDIEILVLKDDMGISCGMYMDRDKGNICFWEQEGR